MPMNMRIIFLPGLFFLTFLPGCVNHRTAERPENAPAEGQPGAVKATAAHLTLFDGESRVELRNLLFYAGDRYVLLKANDRTFIIDTIVVPSMTVRGTSVVFGDQCITIGGDRVTINNEQFPSSEGDIFLIREKGRNRVVERLNDRSMERGIEKAGFNK